MKNILNAFKLTIAVFCLQILTSSSVFAQIEDIPTTIEKKCTECTDFKTAGDMNGYATNGCRIFQTLCDLNANDNTIRIKSTEQTLNASDDAFTVIGGTTTNLILHMAATEETEYSLTPKVSFVDIKGKEVAEIETNVFQQYTFNNNDLRSVRGIKEIKKLQPNEQVLLTSKVAIPKDFDSITFIKVELSKTNALTSETTIVQTYFKEITIE
jgi:hypothetical protein